MTVCHPAGIAIAGPASGSCEIGAFLARSWNTTCINGPSGWFRFRVRRRAPRWWA